MKKHLVLCVLVIIGSLTLMSLAEDEYRDFTDTEGRVMRGKVTACDFKRNKVTIEREDNQRRFTVGVDAFSKADQDYFKEWYMANDLLSDRKLKIECKEELVKKWKDEKISSVTGTSSGNYVGDESMTKKYEQIAFQISFQNTGAIPLENLRLEYKIYYEQSRAGINPDVDQNILEGDVKIAKLEPNKKHALTSKTVDVFKEVFSHDSNIIYSNPPVDGKGEVHGIRARIYLTLPSGKEVYREFSQPGSLSNDRFPWKKRDNL